MILSIIIPTLNEAALIETTLTPLQPLRSRGHEVILVDGGSDDGTAGLARGQVDRLVESERGRARQMNAGAARASGNVLVFLHADTRLPEGADRLIEKTVAAGARWGRFDVRLDGRHPLLPVIGRLMNLRSRLTGIATGDQAIFVERTLFRSVGGFADLPLMEDIALSRALRARHRPACLQTRVVTSGRRWESRGALRTVVLMWWLRLAYFFGADPARLARRYNR